MKEQEEKERQLASLKKLIQEKNELQTEINELNKQLITEKKSVKEVNEMLNGSIKEYEIVSGNYQRSLEQQKDLNTKISEMTR